MANLLNGFLDNLKSGILGPKGNLGDFAHAARLYVDDSFRLAPKSKFLYHVTFNINDSAGITDPPLTNHKHELNMLVKQVDLPKYTIDVDMVQAYNKKRKILSYNDWINEKRHTILNELIDDFLDTLEIDWKEGEVKGWLKRQKPSSDKVLYSFHQKSGLDTRTKWYKIDEHFPFLLQKDDKGRINGMMGKSHEFNGNKLIVKIWNEDTHILKSPTCFGVVCEIDGEVNYELEEVN